MRTRSRLAAGALACLFAGAWAAPPALAADGGDAVKVMTITDERIVESSGLAVSRRHPGVLYTHNDSSGRPEIYAIGPDGRVRAVLRLAGANARDWEGMAVGVDERGRPALYVGDIGDNLGGAWPHVTVYRVPEPARLHDQTLRATAFRLTYADGPRNAETLMINPRTNRLYVASKQLSGAVYEAPARLRATGSNTLRRIGPAPAMATDGAFSPDGRTLVIRTYWSAQVYAFDDRAAEKLTPLARVRLPRQEQGESIAYTADGRALLVGSEGTGQPIWRVPLPDRALPSPTSTAAPERVADRDRPDARKVGLALVIGVALALGFGLLRRRS
ncbi:hypothetical protein [Thermomonospora catenispora]|uniref:hypothetical protein n=1 Tax=Thermomonospora catenispora TaxID=2493090 RepID=UPI00111EF22F|nr:hypothetical protein [Thermomonospora catenispora]TNY35612.1 hypothetical protein EIO00_17540 [Thermomonospora catenispora]